MAAEAVKPRGVAHVELATAEAEGARSAQAEAAVGARSAKAEEAVGAWSAQAEAAVGGAEHEGRGGLREEAVGPTTAVVAETACEEAVVERVADAAMAARAAEADVAAHRRRHQEVAAAVATAHVTTESLGLQSAHWVRRLGRAPLARPRSSVLAQETSGPSQEASSPPQAASTPPQAASIPSQETSASVQEASASGRRETSALAQGWGASAWARETSAPA